MNIASLLVLALAANAAPPPYSLTVSDEKAEAALRPSWSFFGGRLDVQPVVKAGVLALTETFPYPYPILKRSPYALGGVALAYAGAVDAAAVVTLGAVNLRSHSLLGDDKSAFATPADHFKGKDLSQNQLVSSVYLDAGKRFEAGGWKGAVYAAADALGWTAPGAKYGSDGLLEGSVGSAWLKKSGDREISFFGAVGAEAAPGSAYRNDGTLTAAPFGRAGAEVAMQSGGRRWGTGVEVQTRRADDSVRPYVDLKAAGAQAVLALELKRSKNAFYPDSQAVAAGVKTKVGKDLEAGVSARYERKRYAMAPAPVDETRVTADLTWTPSSKLVIQSAQAWESARKAEYDKAAQARLNAESQASPDRGRVRAAIAASPSLGEFLSSYKPGNAQGVLTALSEFTDLFSRYNYNNNEGSPPNLESVDQIYRRARQSYLSSNQDPTLVCLGAAQYTAAVAEEMGARAGVPIKAAAVTVKVADERGRADGHAVAAVKTRDLGIVFVDWGRLIPTYTYDTERALRVYQALTGTPAVDHEITDPGAGGRHVGYLFTEEGKLYVNSLTFHGELARPPLAELFHDDPRGEPLATRRYQDLLRR